MSRWSGRRAAARVVVAAVAWLFPVPAGAQALPFHTDTGITTGFQENAGRGFVSLLGREGLLVDGDEAEDPARRELDAFAIVGGAIPLTFTPLWTARVVVPFVHKSLAFDGPIGERLEFDTGGLGDVLVDTKWIFYSDNRPQASTRLGLQAGIKIPTGETDERLPGSEVAPRPLQVGTGAWDVPVELVLTDTEGRWGFHGNVGWRFNFEDDGFEAGDVFKYDAALGLRFLPWVYKSLRDQTLVAYLELNGEVAREDEIVGEENADSGGHLLFVSPDLQWIPTPWLLFEASVQIPVVQDLNGAQLEHETRFQLGGRFRFSTAP
ncbi:MAG: transporter [Gemmatimonadota bacterium]